MTDRHTLKMRQNNWEKRFNKQFGSKWIMTKEIKEFIRAELREERANTLYEVTKMIDALHMPVGRKELLANLDKLKIEEIGI